MTSIARFFVKRQSKFGVVVLAMVATFFGGQALAQSAPPPSSLGTVTVTGTYNGPSSVTVLCTGASCASVIESMVAQYYVTHNEPLSDEPVGSQGQFCTALKNAKPSDCSYSSPPPSPGIGTNWAPNGCGTGSNWLYNKVFSVASTGSYSGNFDAPTIGTEQSFLSACNGHDQCWAMGEDRGTCDLAFGAALDSACGPTDSVCLGWAGLYSWAVSSNDVADANYAASVAERQCALWNHDMRQNTCPNT